MLIATSYTLVLLFFWSLFMGLSVAQRLRLQRLEALEATIQVSQKRNPAIKHLLAYIHSPLDEMQAWHLKSEKVENLANLSVLPLRYRQSLLFADELSETDLNPISKAS